ncbi:uncharacterized protein LOC130668732 [Microplitis mediator]|uniref:uncharacterized protein LOC130668732 n=1 Tax=Microplitis mediator TaxID=375433 RepID=UPI0025568AA3|nr:uncharacterized protein LOC130668732 [Microplitis mediator]
MKIIFFAFFFLTYTSSIIGNVMKDINNDTAKSIIYGWELFFHILNTKTYHVCDGILVTSRIFVTDSWCMKENLKNDTNQQIFVSKIYNLTFQKSYNVNRSNIYYNKNWNHNHNESRQNIAVLYLDQSVDVSKEVNNQTKYVKLTDNINDIDLSNCFVLNYDGYKVNMTYCNTSYNDNFNHTTNNYFPCQEIGNIAVGTPVICNSKIDSNDRILIGILSGEDGFYSENNQTDA